MLPHQERVVDEQKELQTKVEKLETFLFGPIYNKLDVPEQIRLQKQFAYMTLYLSVLEDRIKSF